MNEMSITVKTIIATEWTMFDKAQNIGGRADCQNDPKTFVIMRASQLMAWSEEMQESYRKDLEQAVKEGRNPVAEKYGYMMERTSPDEYAAIQDQLPPRSAEKEKLVERICAAHVSWLEAVTEKYPRLAGQGRSIRRDEDSPVNTSFETYLWGELLTYSDETIRLYAQHVEQLLKEGKNMNAMILENTVEQYGYSSLDAAEARLSGK